jgi:hypothetical protein
LVDAGRYFVGTSVDTAPRMRDPLEAVFVSCNHFLMTATGRDNIWGDGPLDGDATCAAGGLDARGTTRWLVKDNDFEGIYCDPEGAPRPAHGVHAELRDGMTYAGGLARPAIGFSDRNDSRGVVIERNRIVDCARGIRIGPATGVSDVSVRNNMLASQHAGGSEHGVPIRVEPAEGVAVDFNTVISTATEPYPNAIEYALRLSPAPIRANLTNRPITRVGSGSASLRGNATDADPGWFRDALHGDLHLARCDIMGARAVQPTPTVPYDYDRDPRRPDGSVGADECVP